MLRISSFTPTIVVQARNYGTARDLIEEMWRNRNGVLSTQVLQEFYVNVRRKAIRPIPAAEATQLLRDYLAWEIVP